MLVKTLIEILQEDFQPDDEIIADWLGVETLISRYNITKERALDLIHRVEKVDSLLDNEAIDYVADKIGEESDTK